MPTIRIDGLVGHEILLDATAFAALPHVSAHESFACEEGWMVPGLRWTGVALTDVLALAQPLETARFVRVHSGDYTIAVPLQPGNALICDMLDDQPLSVEHGGPWRLVVPGGQCLSSVKWVDRLELTPEQPVTTGEGIARARLGSQP